MKKALSLALALVMALSLCACANSGGSSSDSGSGSGGSSSSSGSSSDSDTIRLAVVGPMTGADADYGTGFKNSAMIMADKWNAEGGVLGTAAELIRLYQKYHPHSPP